MLPVFGKIAPFFRHSTCSVCPPVASVFRYNLHFSNISFSTPFIYSFNLKPYCTYWILFITWHQWPVHREHVPHVLMRTKWCIGGSRGGGDRGTSSPLFLGWSPPFFFWSPHCSPQKNTHTEKKWSKSGKHEARCRLKRTPKHTKYAQIF